MQCCDLSAQSLNPVESPTVHSRSMAGVQAVTER